MKDHFQRRFIEDFADLKTDFVRLEADLSITRKVSDTFKNRMITRKRWC